MERIGKIIAITRYPVKSMSGEEINSSYVTKKGLLGDRRFALIDKLSNKVVSAKNPKKWPNIFFYSSKFLSEPALDNIGDIRITFPDQSFIDSNHQNINKRLSDSFKHEVVLSTIVPDEAQLEECFAEIEEIQHSNKYVDANMANGTFFDLGMIHLVTTSTLNQLKSLAPESDFNLKRFRPNILLKLDFYEDGFIENQWIGKKIAIGNEVVLSIKQDCPRCIMTTLEQENLQKDINILRTIVKTNHGNLGIYADVICEGTINIDDPIYLLND